MPKIVKTAKSTSATHDFNELFINMVKSVSAALGIDYQTNSDGNTHYIPMDSLGYPGWCIIFIIDGNGNASIGIRTMSNGVPNYSGDSNYISVKIGAGFSSGTIKDYNAMTCVVFRDNTNDTISFSANPGSDEHAGEYGVSSDVSRYTFKAFFAKDVNDGVLCGIGDAHISSIRSIDSNAKSPATGLAHEPTKIGLPTCLHLTKMINYLSAGYPEMKTAYVAVIRPESPRDKTTSAPVDFNSAYYADGARWACAGVYDNMGSSPSTVSALFKPFEPWVKY